MISLSPHEVEHRFTLLGIPNRFTSDEKAQSETTKAGHGHDNILAFAIPQANAGLNILNLRKLCGTDPARQPAFFDHPWYLEETFGREDCTPGWHYLYNSVLPDSISQPLHYADNLRAGGLELPSAIEVVVMLFLHYAGTGEQFLQKKHTWCKDRASLDRWVTVGAFGRNGLFISAHPADFASRGLGICAKLMPQRDGLFEPPEFE